MCLSVIPVATRRENTQFDINLAIYAALSKNGLKLDNGDILVISTKYISTAQGRIIHTSTVKPSAKALQISTTYHIRPELSEAILRETDQILGGIPGFVLTSGNYMIAPNAGIDRSNTTKDRLILYPLDPYSTAEHIRRKIFLDHHVHVGIILVDSRLAPARIGTTGVAVSCAGIEPVLDMRGSLDLDGKPLKVTFQAIADNLATIANQEMGEGAESIPFAIIHNSKVRLTSRIIHPTEVAVPPNLCVYVRGLSQISLI